MASPPAEKPVHWDPTDNGRAAGGVVDATADKTLAMAEPAFRGIDSREFAEVLNLAQQGAFSKPELDFAFAALLIRSRLVSERQLRQMLKDWTSFGEVSLHSFLQRQGSLSEEDLAEVEAETRRFLRSIEAHLSWEACRQSPSRRTSWLLERIDPNGKIAKIFGLSGIPRGVPGAEERSFLSRFRLIRKLGQGGVGTVWLAVDTSLNRYVAVKEIVAEGGLNPWSTIRFRREAEITGRLEHPSIVPLYLFGENGEDGRLFYVMRYLGNRTLDDAIREYHERRELGQEDPLAFHALLTAFVSVCQAIAYAHSRKVIHRDLKPQNIALDHFGQVIVLDWGLARSLGMDDPSSVPPPDVENDRDELEATLAGQVMGTPMYMAPEQAAGRVDDIDEQTDVYGLGAILYAILTGYAPHELSSETLGAGSRMSALLDAIVDGKTTPPRRLNRNVPAGLEAICLKALSRGRHARYPSAAELSDDLRRWMADEPISAMRERAGQRFYRWTRRHPRLTQAAAILCALAVAAGLTGSVISYEAHVASGRAELQAAVDDCRSLQRKLSAAVDALADDVRFMGSVPPVAGVLQESGGEAGLAWSDQLKTIYRGLLDANPNYAAVTCWGHPEVKGTPKPIRVENSGAQRGLQRLDLTAFFTRHLPAISGLTRGDVYIGVPGRKGAPSTPGELPTDGDRGRRSGEPISVCIVAGIAVFDATAARKLGSVAIECDIERILRDHIESSPGGSRTIYLTDNEGRCVMRFRRETGLRPVDPVHSVPIRNSQFDAYFSDSDAVGVCSVGAALCAAKIPLSPRRSDQYMGLIIDSH
ncbi:serine/threonine-protein kinase [Planctellipticum variicoloris]|uniref:serine/threonine-protein kinase n=1 Tax=Planctellipticum variicoloris TaxID=3064265 RepID=UPI003013C736|nr:serine/threonine protein kinase [Planctomycetaceae bacterium SH412]